MGEVQGKEWPSGRALVQFSIGHNRSRRYNRVTRLIHIMANAVKFRLSKIRWHFQFSLLTLLSAVTIIAVFLGVAPIVRMEWALRALSNKDVEGEFSAYGYEFAVNSSSAMYFKRLGPKANKSLQGALANPENSWPPMFCSRK
jgi:hypothetical protein